jgi:hypothetical protein
MPVDDETMRKNPARILTGLVATLWMFTGTDAISQGTLAPTNAPSETMKSLQEIWDRIGDMEATQSAQQADIDQVQEQTATIEQQNSMLLDGQTNLQTQQAAIQDDPRTPISSLPYIINGPGSYYVTGNLSSTGHGIVIESSGVTVDLMGFSLTGDGGLDDYGIHVAGATNAMIDKVVIKNGTVSGFYRGLRCDYMNNSRIE